MKPLEQICNLGFELCGNWTHSDDGSLELVLDNVLTVRMSCTRSLSMNRFRTLARLFRE